MKWINKGQILAPFHKILWRWRFPPPQFSHRKLSDLEGSRSNRTGKEDTQNPMRFSSLTWLLRTWRRLVGSVWVKALAAAAEYTRTLSEHCFATRKEKNVQSVQWHATYKNATYLAGINFFAARRRKLLIWGKWLLRTYQIQKPCDYSSSGVAHSTPPGSL